MYGVFETPGGVLGFMGRHVCFIFFFFLFLLSSSGELSAERIDLKFSLNIAPVFSYANKLHSAFHPVVGLQFSKIDLGYHDFHLIALLHLFKSQKRVSGGFLGQWIRQRHSKLGKNSWYGVNGGPDAKNEIHAPGDSTHARFTFRTVGAEAVRNFNFQVVKILTSHKKNDNKTSSQRNMATKQRKYTTFARYLIHWQMWNDTKSSPTWL